MAPEIRCEHCDTLLEFQSEDKRIRFLAHDVEFCRVATQWRVRMLLGAIKRLKETLLEAHEREIKALEALTFESYGLDPGP